jgi:hypothetical protein
VFCSCPPMEVYEDGVDEEGIPDIPVVGP